MRDNSCGSGASSASAADAIFERRSRWCDIRADRSRWADDMRAIERNASHVQQLSDERVIRVRRVPGRRVTTEDVEHGALSDDGRLVKIEPQRLARRERSVVADATLVACIPRPHIRPCAIRMLEPERVISGDDAVTWQSDTLPPIPSRGFFVTPEDFRDAQHSDHLPVALSEPVSALHREIDDGIPDPKPWSEVAPSAHARDRWVHCLEVRLSAARRIRVRGMAMLCDCGSPERARSQRRVCNDVVRHGRLPPQERLAPTARLSSPP